jgi:hypothetical protein
MPGARGQYRLGMFRAPGDYWPARIVVDVARASQAHVGGARAVLLHQMIHCALYFAGCPDVDAHGLGFLAELKRLSARGETWATMEAEMLLGLSMWCDDAAAVTADNGAAIRDREGARCMSDESWRRGVRWEDFEQGIAERDNLGPFRIGGPARASADRQSGDLEAAPPCADGDVGNG